ncbi:MAG: LysM peptidoglycan-binding domain-containing protein [Anaerolineae bacterium]|nr:LysM peptidoglycan-binding domain-containing protein [Anaerolineae bacterium]
MRPSFIFGRDISRPYTKQTTPRILASLTLCACLMMIAPAVSAQAVTPAAPVSTYTVQRGDTLSRIGQQYGVTVQVLAAANGIVDVNRISVGQVLNIPPAGTTVENVPNVIPTAVPMNVPVDPATMTTNTNVTTPIYLPSDANPWPNNTTAYAPPPDIPYDASGINGVPLSSIITLPPQTVATVQMIYGVGQAFKRNPNAFSKLGDSTIENPFFLARFDTTEFNLGSWAYLQPAIDTFRGSWARESAAVKRGLHSWSIYDPMWADASRCQINEAPLMCEIRLNNPMMIIVKLGSNDAGVPDQFEANMRRLVVDATMQGVIPILSTKADRHEGSNINNEIIRKLAAEYSIPLWDFDLLAGTLPARGLGDDQVHLTTFYAHDWRQPEALTRGYGLMNLTGLMALDAVWRAAIGA